MKKIVLIAPALFIFLTGNISCIKGTAACQAKTVQSEQAAIINYAASNGISATAHSSGLYYQIINPGSGPVPTTASTVSVRYTGKLTNGTIFDQQIGTPVTFPLTNVVSGWQIGLQLIHKGGTIKLILPSALAYGCNAFGTIPANSILYFEIELVDVL